MTNILDDSIKTSVRHHRSLIKFLLKKVLRSLKGIEKSIGKRTEHFSTESMVFGRVNVTNYRNHYNVK